MSIQLKSPAEIAKLREANLIVADVLDALEAAAKPGVSTWELNEIADQRLKQLKGESAFLGYHGYPAVLCTSVNEVVVHGIPRKDVVLKDGRHFVHRLRRLQGRLVRRFGPDHPDRRGQPGRPVADDGSPASRWSGPSRPASRATGWGTSAGPCSPTPRPTATRSSASSWATASAAPCTRSPTSRTTATRGKGRRLSAGLVVAIEPMVNAGGPEVLVKDDGWTAVTKDGSLSAHFEHSVAITDDGPVVLSRS